jgi:carbonic anhydrase
MRVPPVCLHANCSCSVALPALGRRSALRAAGGGVALALGFRMPAEAQSALTPEAALQTLMDGNERFVSHQLASFQEDLAELKQNTAGKQEPFAAVLSCADSRVPVELVFDQSIGKVFVVRVAGNVATAETIASLEYGAAVLGTKVLMVLAHEGCGAVRAAMDAKPVPGQISTLYRLLRPAVDRARGDPATAEKANALIQAALLRESSPVLGELVNQKKLNVTAGYYDLATGKVALLN